MTNCHPGAKPKGALEDTENIAEVVELIRKIGMGDRVSFDTFYHRFSALIYSTALRVLASESDAEDVAQEVFFMLWEKAPLYDPSRGKPLTWAITMTRNKAIDRLRSLHRKYRLQDEVQKETAGDDTSTEREPFEDLDHAEKGRLVRSAVLKLNKEQREVIEMVYFGGLTQQEIADRLHKPLGTVKARIRRGMLRLRKMIGSSL